MEKEEYKDEGCDINPIDWDNYDGQGKSVMQEVQGQAILVGFIVVSVFLFLGLILLIWLLI